eukprot:TRINITY_DN9116_c0_g1_i1.p1 TRINITY_DN9116_c0_g1~~TRINITY_DN9116_c0_g1_i1.p1  ORF type:complete len:57 (-),score=1.33 TRINITY_DN9116_c0_g1_i1:150-320(-)
MDDYYDGGREGITTNSAMLEWRGVRIPNMGRITTLVPTPLLLFVVNREAALHSLRL